MAVAQAQLATPASMLAELRQTEEQAEQLREELKKKQQEAVEARMAGAAVLSAVEAAMAPLMAELASARREAGSALQLPDDVHAQASASPRSPTSPMPAPAAAGNSIPELEAEIRHLKIDIEHYQDRLERLEIDDRQHSHELGRLRQELKKATDGLGYEVKRVKHHELCQHLGTEETGWAGLGPAGIGKRTLEVRAEMNLREFAEQRLGRLSRDVTRMAGDTATQQASIEQLSRRLNRIRSQLQEKDAKLSGAASHAVKLHTNLQGGALSTSAKAGQGIMQSGRARKESSRSTGKLPQLSF